jgi:hypothetical protein
MSDEHHKITGADIGIALRSLLFETAKLVAALTTIAIPIITWVPAALDRYLTAKLSDLTVSFERLDARVSLIQAPFVEFLGIGLISKKGPFTPGNIVEVSYQVKRNLPCRTTVVIRYKDAVTNRINTELTDEITATQAPITEDYVEFTVSLRLPERMPKGRWSYTPILLPEDCNGVAPVMVPASEYFDVE